MQKPSLWLLLCIGNWAGADSIAFGYYWQLERRKSYVGMCCLLLGALLLDKLTVTPTEVERAPDVILTAVERKSEAEDLEASLDNLGGVGYSRLLAPSRRSATPRRLQLAHRGVCDRCCGLGGVLLPHQPLHLLVQHAIQRLEERRQPP